MLIVWMVKKDVGNQAGWQGKDQIYRYYEYLLTSIQVLECKYNKVCKYSKYNVQCTKVRKQDI